MKTAFLACIGAAADRLGPRLKDEQQVLLPLADVAIQIFAAHHQIPDETATPTQRQEFLDKVKGLSRVIAMTRALYGFSVPAAPELQMDPDKLNEASEAALALLDDVKKNGVSEERIGRATLPSSRRASP